MVKGSSHKSDSIEKIRLAIRNRSTYIWQMVYNSGGNTNVLFIDNLTEWASSQKLSKGSLHQVSDSYYKRKSYKGWTVKKHDLSKLSEKALEIIEAALTRFKATENAYVKFRKYVPKKVAEWKAKLVETYDNFVDESPPDTSGKWKRVSAGWVEISDDMTAPMDICYDW